MEVGGATYLDVAEAFSNRRGYEHRESGYDARGEEKRAQLSFLETEFALKEICHPGSGLGISGARWLC